MCAAPLLAASSAQARVIGIAKENKYCTGFIESKEIKGKLTVRPGTRFCELFDATVDGNVSVDAGANFDLVKSVIKGSLSTDGANLVGVESESEVQGDVNIDATSATEAESCFQRGQSVCIVSSKFGGNVSITDTSPLAVLFAGNALGQNLTCTGNTSVTNDGFMNAVAGQEFGQCVGL
jgi:hypothetical protein